MINAARALELTKETHLNNIEAIIKEAIERGEDKCEILPSEQFVSAENRDLLRELGYKVTEKETKIGIEILISWE